MRSRCAGVLGSSSPSTGRKPLTALAPKVCLSLRRFAIPQHFVQVLRSIYHDRRFVVREGGEVSCECHQDAGILQGCPLSPFLFSILMTMLMHDARTMLTRTLGHEYTCDLGVEDILYADDTMLVGTSSQALQKYMDCISACGKMYGLSLNATKLECLSINTETEIVGGLGGQVSDKARLKYLGALLSNDGYNTSELSRRIGIAKDQFLLLRRCCTTHVF